MSLHAAQVGVLAGLKTLGSGTKQPEIAGNHPDEFRIRRTKPKVRRVLDAPRMKVAASIIAAGLPEPGETVHAIWRGGCDLAHIAWALIDALKPARVDHLVIATLGTAQRHVAELIRRVDEGEIAKVDFVCSIWFRSVSDGRPIFNHLAAELARRGSRAAAGRTHAKIITLKTSDGRGFVVESSANLRTVRNAEFAVITQDRQLADFYAAWVDSIIEEANRHAT